MDLHLTPEGDFRIAPDGDIQTTTGMNELKQEIAFRLKTERGSCRIAPGVGGRLDQLIGQLLSPETLQLGERLINEALVGSRAAAETRVTVRGVPVNRTQALFVIELAPSAGAPQLFPIPFDFTRGIVTERMAQAVGAETTE